jgi:hypothetical protein
MSHGFLDASGFHGSSWVGRDPQGRVGRRISLFTGSFRMKRHLVIVPMLSTLILAGPSAPKAFAIKQFLDEFKEVYVKEGTPLATEVEAAKCNLCHVGKSKKDRNAYGEALAKLLDKKEDAKNVEKIRQALAEVSSLPSDPAVPGAPTFGDLIAEGKLPAGLQE